MEFRYGSVRSSPIESGLLRILFLNTHLENIHICAWQREGTNTAMKIAHGLNCATFTWNGNINFYFDKVFVFSKSHVENFSNYSSTGTNLLDASKRKFGGVFILMPTFRSKCPKWLFSIFSQPVWNSIENLVTLFQFKRETHYARIRVVLFRRTAPIPMKHTNCSNANVNPDFSPAKKKHHMMNHISKLHHFT